MKKLTALLLAMIIALSLSACSSENPYEKYEDIFELLDKGKYDKAIALIEKMKNPDDSGNENTQGSNESSGGSNNDTSGSSGSANLQEPDEETKALLELYNAIAGCLDEYDPGTTLCLYTSEAGHTMYGQEALQYCYEKLQQMECLDKWLEQGYGNKNVTSDRLALLGRFARLPDMLLSATATTEDQKGSIDMKSATYWHYNADGRLILYSPSSCGGAYGELYDRYGYDGYDYEISYNEQNRISSIQIKHPTSGAVHCLITPSYDANGRKTSEEIRTKSGTVTYTYSYDAKGRLIRIEMPGGFNYSKTLASYSYDGSGKIKQTVLAYFVYNGDNPDRMCKSVTTDYTWKGGSCYATVTNTTWYNESSIFDSSGKITGYNYAVASEAVDILTYEYKDGKVVRQITEYGATVYTDGSATQQPYAVCKTVELLYGDYYSYSPDNG